MDDKLFHGNLPESIGELVVTRRRRDRLTQRRRASGPSPGVALAQLLDSAELARDVQALSVHDFSALVQLVGVRDAGEVVALATSRQLQAALDDDLFVNATPGAPEVIDGGRFVSWLEVLLEAGEPAAAARVAALSEDYVALALSKVVLVLDAAWQYWPKSARSRDVIGDDELGSAVAAELGGYLLVERLDVGWDAVLQVLLALDQDHHEYLQRVLARCAATVNDYLEDEDPLSPLSAADEALAEDVRAEREERRDALGYVDARSARAFLELARMPVEGDPPTEGRDIVTRTHLGALATASGTGAGQGARPSSDTAAVSAADARRPDPSSPAPGERVQPGMAIAPGTRIPFLDALEALSELAPPVHAARLEELAHLANVLLAGASVGRRRFSPDEAGEAALSTVALGAELRAQSEQHAVTPTRATAGELLAVLEACPADLLFRRASAVLGVHGQGVAPDAILHHRDELTAALAALSRAVRDP